MYITLKNEFHNTECRLRAAYGKPLSPTQIRRARRALCGVSGCVCGGNLGERGENPEIDAGMDDYGNPIISIRGE